MSLSWTSVLRPTPVCRAGIALGRSQLCAVVLAQGAHRPEVRAVHVQPLPATLFEAQPDAAAEDALVQGLLAISAEFRGLYGPVHVALPDTVLRSTVLEFDELPASAQLRHDLLRWRFARDWQRNEEALECRGDDLGQDGPKRLVFAQAGDSAWLSCVRQALKRAGIGSWSLNAALAYRFNGFHDMLAADAGALLTVDPDGWSLLLWDEGRRVRHVMTRLRHHQAGADEAAEMADETERAILAYVQTDSRRRVGRLHLAGSEGDVTALAREFDARLREPARVLQWDSHIHARGHAALRDGLAPTALAAALNP